MLYELLNLLILLFSGLAIRTSLVLARQQWARSFAATVTYLILPIVGYVIIRVISESISLSLGLIGALSIVRFRHPVRSPLELTVYFVLLSIGISLSQREDLTILLVSSTVLIIGTFGFLRSRGWFFSKADLIQTDYESSGARIMISSSGMVEGLESDENVTNISRGPGDGYRYVMAFDNPDDARSRFVELNQNELCESIELDLF